MSRVDKKNSADQLQGTQFSAGETNVIKARQEAYVGFFGDAYGSLTNSFASQANGFVQLSNKVLGTEISELKTVHVDNPESSWGAWSASLIGQSGSMALELFVGRKLGGTARLLKGKESAASVIKGMESASSKMYSGLAFGAVRGGVFTPTNDANHFWSDRFKNMTSSTVTVGTMTGISLSMERTAAKLGGGFLKSTMRNGYANSAVGGFIGGGLGDMTASALNGQAPDATSNYWRHVGRAGTEFALVGIGAHGLDRGVAALHDSAKRLGAYSAIADSWDAANMALGRGVPLKRYVEYYGADANLNSSNLVGPFANYRVHVSKTASLTNIDHAARTINLPKSGDSSSHLRVPLADQATLAHELGHGPMKPEASTILSTGGHQAKPFVEYKGESADAPGQKQAQKNALKPQEKPQEEERSEQNQKQIEILKKTAQWKTLSQAELRAFLDQAVEGNRFADEYALGVLLDKYETRGATSEAALKYEKVRNALVAESVRNSHSDSLSPTEFDLLTKIAQMTRGRTSLNHLFDARKNTVKLMADSIINVYRYHTDGLAVDNPQFFQIESWIADESRVRSQARNPWSEGEFDHHYLEAQSLLAAGATDEVSARKMGAISCGVREFYSHQIRTTKIQPSWLSNENIELINLKVEPARLHLMFAIPGIETWSPAAMAVAYHAIGKLSGGATPQDVALIESAKEAWAVDARMPLSIAKQVGPAPLPDRLLASIAFDHVLASPEFQAASEAKTPEVRYEMPTRRNRRTGNDTNQYRRNEAAETGARRALDSGAVDAQFFAVWESMKSRHIRNRALVAELKIPTAIDAAIQVICENDLSTKQRAQFVHLAYSPRSEMSTVFQDLASMNSEDIKEALTHLNEIGVKITDRWKVEDRDHELLSSEAWLILKNWSRLTPRQRQLPNSELLQTTKAIAELNLSPPEVVMLDQCPRFANWLQKGKKNDKDIQNLQPAERSRAVLRTWAQLTAEQSVQFASWLDSNYPGRRGAEPYIDRVINQWVKLSEAERHLPIAQQVELTKLLAELTPQHPLAAQLKIPAEVNNQIALLKPWEQMAAIRAWREQVNERFGEQHWDKQWPDGSIDVNRWNETVSSPRWLQEFETRYNNLRSLGRSQIISESNDAYRILQTYSPQLEPAFLQMISSALADVAVPAQYIQRIQGDQYKQVLSRLLGDQGPEAVSYLASLDAFSAASDNFVFGAAARTTWENDSAVKLLTTFGKQWSRWLDLQSKQTRDKDGNLLFAGRDAHDASIIAPLAAQADAQSLSQWLFKFYDRPSSEIGVVGTRWTMLTAAERNATYKNTVSAARKYVYANRKDESFAVEAAKWGVPETANWGAPEANYAAFEKRYLDSLDTPNPFPLDKTWRYEPDPSHVNGLTARFLPRNDPRGLFIGGHTDCCQHPLGAGMGAAWYGQESPHAGYFVVEDKDDNMVAASLVWESTEGGLVFDSIESKGSGNNEPIVAKLYELAAQDLKHKYHTINVGSGTYAGRKGVNLNRWPLSPVTLMHIDKDIYSDAAVQRAIPAQKNAD